VVLVCVPVPQLTEQALHAPGAPILPATTGVPQDRDSDDGPTHPAPHEFPAMHTRDLVCVPDPHLTEHALHAPNAPYLLLTIGVPHPLDCDRAPEHPAPHELPAIQVRVLV